MTNTYNNKHYWETLHADMKGQLSAVGYKDLGEGFNQATYRIRKQALHSIIDKVKPDGKSSLLEGAVGIGAYGEVWQRLDVTHWVGVDISSVAIEEVSKRFPMGEFFSADLSQEDALVNGLQGRKFDIATAIDFLYHIVDDIAFSTALLNLAQNVRIGGILIVSDIFPDEDYWVASHVKCRPLETYRTRLEALGFEFVAREPVFAILGGSIPRNKHSRFARIAPNLWRTVATISRKAPNWAGYLLGLFLSPIDDVLKRSGMSKGTNLELAAFRRIS